MFKKPSTPFLAFLQTTGLVFYIILVTLLMSFLSDRFEGFDSEIFAPIIMLLVFIMSAVISATLVLGKAGILFWDKNYRQSFTLIGWTVGWGLLYIFLFILINIFFQ